MASSIIGGLIAAGSGANTITVADSHKPQLEKVQSTFGVNTNQDNRQAVSDTDVIVIAVKPNIVSAVCTEIADSVKPEALVISIAAGVTEGDIARWVGPSMAIIRCMPNTPALLGHGASALFANRHCTAEHLATAEAMLKATGIALWVEDENALDTVTSLSGSGPAYFFYLIECMTQSAIAQGMDKDTAETLAIETAYGAAAMARQRTEPPAQLRQNVTSKGGTTAAALESFEAEDFPGIINRGMHAARDRARQLAKEFGAS